jgi:hypothetical protein
MFSLLYFSVQLTACTQFEFQNISIGDYNSDDDNGNRT